MSFWSTAWYLQRPFPTPFCRPAELIYQPPDLTKPVFDIDKIGLTGLCATTDAPNKATSTGMAATAPFVTVMARQKIVSTLAIQDKIPISIQA